MSGVNDIRSSFLDYFVNNGHEAPPIVNGDVMFVATPGNQVIAIDARQRARAVEHCLGGAHVLVDGQEHLAGVARVTGRAGGRVCFP